MATKLVTPEKPSEINDEQLGKVQYPDLNFSTFKFGKNKDGSPRTWKLQPLSWKFEKQFRKSVMPMLASSYAPFETIFSIMAQPMYTDMAPSFMKAVSTAETDVDEYLTKAVHIILLSQDTEITVEWVEDSAASREQLLEIVEAQCELHKIMDKLGERLAERLVNLAKMLGLNIDLPSLTRLWKQASENFSVKISRAVATVPNVISRSTENLPEIPLQESEVNKKPKQKQSQDQGVGMPKVVAKL